MTWPRLTRQLTCPMEIAIESIQAVPGDERTFWLRNVVSVIGKQVPSRLS